MILGVDPGERRVGVAAADEETRFARPLEVIDRRETDSIRRIAELVADRSVTKIVVGLPLTLEGSRGDAVDALREWVSRLRAAVAVEVVEHDERLTTVVAERALRASGANPARRKERRDAVAAQVLLQDYLDTTGAPA